MDKGGGGGDVQMVDQSALIAEQGRQNRITQFTPYGNLVFGNIGSNGAFQPSTNNQAAVLEESPYQQRYRMGNEDIGLMAQNNAATRVGNLPLAPIDISGLAPRIDSVDWSQIDPVMRANQFSQDADEVAQATFNRSLGLLQPVWDREDRQMETKLANMGLPMGGEAYKGAWDDSMRRRSEQQRTLLDSAEAARGAEQSRLFGLASASRGTQLQDQLQNIGLSNSSRAAEIGEQQSLRSTEMNEIQNLLGTNSAQPISAKNYFAPTSVDVMGPASLSSNQANQRAAQEAQQEQAMMQGVMTLAATAAILAFSDENMKENIEDTGDVLPLIENMNVKKWNYKPEYHNSGLPNVDGNPHMGAMAQEMKEKLGVGDGHSFNVVDLAGVLMKGEQELSQRIKKLEARA